MQYEIKSKPSGGHWVAWITADGSTKPAGSAILVGQTREEAEAHAQRWADRLTADARLRRD